MKRGLIVIANENYDCSHLNPFLINLPGPTQGERGYRVLVSFSHHTFTRSFDDNVDPLDFLYVEQGDRRCFCQDRYLASKTLPRLIETQSNGKAYFAQNDNFMLLEQGVGAAPYAVFFSIQRARNSGGADVVMFVKSAYEKPNLIAKSRLSSISFKTLVHKKVRGEKITKPKK